MRASTLHLGVVGRCDDGLGVFVVLRMDLHSGWCVVERSDGELLHFIDHRDELLLEMKTEWGSEWGLCVCCVGVEGGVECNIWLN